MSENIKLQINVSTNLLNKYIMPKQILVDVQTSEITKDEVIMNKKDDKTRGRKTLKTILGFGSSTAVGGFVGKFLAEKKLPQLDKILSNKEDKIYDEIDKIFLPLNRAKGSYDKLEKIIDDIIWGIEKPECYIFESKNKENADKIISFISKITGKTYEVIDMGNQEIPFDSILKTRKNSDEIKLFNLENTEKCLGIEFKEKHGKFLQDILTNTKNKNIYFFHVDKIKPEYGDFTRRLYIDGLKDFDSYAKLRKEYAKTEIRIDKIDKLKKLNLPAIGIAAGLAVATGIFSILKIKNKKGVKNENISNQTK